MDWSKNKFKKLSPAVACILLTLFIFAALSIPQTAHASWLNPTEWVDIAKSAGQKLGVTVLDGVGRLLQTTIALFVKLAGDLFDIALDENFKIGQHRSTIEIGWKISRDVANIFFIVFLLGIAIATIFRISSYNIKSLLPLLIIMALLINFSLAIGFVIIDFTHVLGKQFHEAVVLPFGSYSAAIVQGTMSQAGLKKGDITEKLEAKNKELIDCGLARPGFAPCTDEKKAQILNEYRALLAQIGNLPEETIGEIIKSAKLVWANVILLSVMVFVLFAAAIMMIIRLVVLSILLVLAPLAFLFYILPATRHLWNKWWSTFFSHAFFLPAFLFLMYFAVLFTINTANQVNTLNDLTEPRILFAYTLAVIMLLAALIIGRTMGVYGASAVINVTSKARRFATGFAGAAAYRNLVAKPAQSFARSQALQHGAPPGVQRLTKALEGVAAFKPGGRTSLVEKQKEKASLEGLTDQQAVEKLNTLSLPQRDLSIESLSTRRIAELRHMARNNPDNLRTVEDSISRIRSRDADKADKIDEEIAKVTSHLPAKERGQEFMEAPGKRQAAMLRVSKKEDIQQIAKGFATDLDKHNFVNTIEKLQTKPDNRVSPDKLNDALSVLPAMAASIHGRSTHETVAKTDFEKAAAADLTHVIGDIVEHAAPKQTGKIMERNDDVSRQYLSKMQDGFNKAGKNVDAFAKTFEQNNPGMANKLRHDSRFRESLGLIPAAGSGGTQKSNQGEKTVIYEEHVGSDARSKETTDERAEIRRKAAEEAERLRKKREEENKA